jgi:hypothetical protein
MFDGFYTPDPYESRLGAPAPSGGGGGWGKAIVGGAIGGAIGGAMVGAEARRAQLRAEELAYTEWRRSSLVECREELDETRKIFGTQVATLKNEAAPTLTGSDWNSLDDEFSCASGYAFNCWERYGLSSEKHEKGVYSQPGSFVRSVPLCGPGYQAGIIVDQFSKFSVPRICLFRTEFNDHSLAVAESCVHCLWTESDGKKRKLKLDLHGGYGLTPRKSDVASMIFYRYNLKVKVEDYALSADSVEDFVKLLQIFLAEVYGEEVAGVPSAVVSLEEPSAGALVWHRGLAPWLRKWWVLLLFLLSSAISMIILNSLP